MSRYSSRWGQTQNEKSRQRGVRFELDKVFQDLIDGKTESYGYIQRMKCSFPNAYKGFLMYSDMRAVDDAREKFGITDEQMEAWRIQYEALPKSNP